MGKLIPVTSSMKLLIISYSYAPELTPRAFRWAEVATKLTEMGHQVHILSAAISGGEEDGEVTVYRVRDWLINASRRVAPSSPAVNSNDMAAKLWPTLRKFIRNLWRAVYWPDFACGWIIPATSKARALCQDNKYDWVISVSHPFTGHFVGLLLNPKKYGSSWLVDIGDPFYLMKEPAPNNPWLYSWLSHQIERKVLKGADSISVTTQPTRLLYEKNFAFSINKIKVIPPLVSLPKINGNHVYKKDGIIRLVYVGTLYSKLRNPKAVIECFSNLISIQTQQKIELHFYGAINDCHDEFEICCDSVRSAIYIHGIVSRAEVLQAMIRADVLVNIGNHSESQLASKVVEYMALGKPILNFTTIEHDTSLTALANYPSVMNIQKTEKNLTSGTITSIYDFILNPPAISNSHIEAVRAQYSSGHIANMYASILESR